MFIVELIFWLSVLGIVYTYAIYPVLLIGYAAMKQAVQDVLFVLKRTKRRATLNDYLPTVGVIIAAYNEEKDIGDRINDLLAQDYPAEKLTIYIGSDGSSDKTAEIIQSFTAPNLRIFPYQENRGKVSVLNDLFEAAQDEIIVLSDANTEFSMNNISQLVRHFRDEKVGAVCGELVIKSSSDGENQDSLYWRYERVLKFFEGKINGLLGANGANYAIRNSLYQPLKKDSIVDDFMIVMNIAKQGYRVKYDIQSVAYEDEAPSTKDEYKRRIRIGAGNYQAFTRLKYFLNPFVGARFFTYFSHKVLRWFVPHFMIIALITNYILVNEHIVYFTLFVLQLIKYSVILLIHFTQHKIQYPSIIKFPYFIVSMNVGLFRGFLNFISGRATGRWNRTER